MNNVSSLPRYSISIPYCWEDAITDDWESYCGIQWSNGVEPPPYGSWRRYFNYDAYPITAEFIFFSRELYTVFLLWYDVERYNK